MNLEVEELAANSSTKPITPVPGASDSEAYIKALLDLPSVEPWPEPVDGKRLLDELAQTLGSYVFLPKWAPETLALWIVHIRVGVLASLLRNIRINWHSQNSTLTARKDTFAQALARIRIGLGSISF